MIGPLCRGWGNYVFFVCMFACFFASDAHYCTADVIRPQMASYSSLFAVTDKMLSSVES